jgi:hypothetical protein
VEPTCEGFWLDTSSNSSLDSLNWSKFPYRYSIACGHPRRTFQPYPFHINPRRRSPILRAPITESTTPESCTIDLATFRSHWTPSTTVSFNTRSFSYRLVSAFYSLAT